MKETKACIESSTAPALNCMVAYFIKFINDWKHLLCCHTGCNQGLMCITQNGFHNFNRFFFNFCHNCSPYLFSSSGLPGFTIESREKSEFLVSLLDSVNSHKCSGSNGCTDNTGNVWSHCMHQKEVGRIGLSTNLLGYTGCHRYR